MAHDIPQGRSASPASTVAGSPPSEDTSHPFLDKEQQKIRQLFDGIAHRYDFLNHVLSFNLDHRWRRRAIRMLGVRAAGVYLDACCGTGDLTLALCQAVECAQTQPSNTARGESAAPRGQVIGSDFSLGMLRLGCEKGRLKGAAAQWLAGDTLRLPFPSGHFDGATVAFGIRNVENLEGGLRELRRVLKPGGRLVLLEFTAAPKLMRPAVSFYTQRILPRIGNWLSRSPDRAYSYLNESIDRWPNGRDLAKTLEHCEFTEVRWQRLFPGNVALHTGTQPR